VLSINELMSFQQSLYQGKGFKMLPAQEQYCCLDTVVNAFTTLMSLFNNMQGKSEQILESCFQFDGMIMDMACSKSILPPIHLVMLVTPTPQPVLLLVQSP
jgi:hypothetical protein